MSTHVAIMAGGIGSRLWPLSTPGMPKQFIDMLGVGKSLIQLTVERFRPLCEEDHFWVVTSEDYVPTVKTQLPFIPEQQIIAEPVGRNTAPCIALVCAKIAARFPDADVIVSPADAIILEKEHFAQVMRKAVDFIHGSGNIVTVGIKPTRPDTGYGYICAESVEYDSVVKVREFREKPDLPTAEEYLKRGNFFWNAGIFVWSVATINAQLRRHAPSIMEKIDKIAPHMFTGDESAAMREHFPQCEKISIDYAVMEKSSDIYTIAADLGWSDLGGWNAVGEQLRHDSMGNAVAGENVRLFGCRDCIVHAGDAQSLAVEGLEGYVVANMNGGILICRRQEIQRIKEFSGSIS